MMPVDTCEVCERYISNGLGFWYNRDGERYRLCRSCASMYESGVLDLLLMAREYSESAHDTVRG